MPDFQPGDRVVGDDRSRPAHYRVPGTVEEATDDGLLVRFDDGLTWIVRADALRPAGGAQQQRPTRLIPPVVIPDPPCDCGHPNEGHSRQPGVGCTHRPCFCLSPVGERVPRVNAFAPPLRPDGRLIVRALR